ncbi:MAG: hypothetical protein ABI699_15680 [Caldimonas sp.]
MGYLDELKRQADEARARDTVDLAALERNSLVTDGACQAASRYLSSLAQQLNVLKPVSKAAYRFDAKNTFRNLEMSNFRCDSRLRRNRHAEVFDHVVLGFDLKTGTRVTISKDFPPESEKLEARLTQCGARFHSEILYDPEDGRFLEKRFEFLADFHGAVRMLPDHDRAWIQFQIVNLEGFETVTVQFPAFEVGTARLDDLARWLVGQPNAFLRDGKELRRVEF